MINIKEKGFTLVEALVAVAIIGLIGYILADLLAKSFKGSDKTKLVSKVVQNGQVALNNLSQAIRNADNIVCIGNLPSNSQSNSALTIASSGDYTRFYFIPAGSNSNGYIAKNVLNIIKLPANLSDICTNQEVTDYFTAPSTSNLTDNSQATGVSVTTTSSSNGPFVKTSQYGFKDAVTIQFQVGPSVTGGGSFENQIGGSGVIDFKTTVQLR